MFDKTKYAREYYRKYSKKGRERRRKYVKENIEKVRKSYKIYHKKYAEREKEYNENWRKEHPDKAREYARKYRKEHPGCGKKTSKERSAKYRQNHLEECRERQRKWKKEHPEQRRERDRKILSTSKGKIDNRVSSAIYNALKGNKAGRQWETLVGYTKDDLRNHIRKNFKDGMTWKKFMTGEIHIHHDVPKSYFNCTSTDDPRFKECWALHNLQPLWAKDNMSKKDRNYQLPLPLWEQTI
jgi:hypothetical protein